MIPLRFFFSRFIFLYLVKINYKNAKFKTFYSEIRTFLINIIELIRFDKYDK